MWCAALPRIKADAAKWNVGNCGGGRLSTAPDNMRTTCHVRFTSKSGHQLSAFGFLLCAIADANFAPYQPSFAATIFSTLKVAVELANAVSASCAIASNGLCR